MINIPNLQSLEKHSKGIIIYGVIETNSQVVYGYSRKKASYKRFIPSLNPSNPYYPFKKNIIIVPTTIKLIPYLTYASVSINFSDILSLDPNNANLIKGEVRHIFGKVGDHKVETLFLNNVYKDIITTKEFIKYDEYFVDNFAETRVNIDNELIYTIDPQGCVDIDDAISISKDNKYTTVKIHIADVAAYILPNTELDTHLKSLVSSVYLPEEVKHILPSVLVDKYSLNMKERKSVVTLEINYIKHQFEYNIADYKFYRSSIKITKNLSYEDANDVQENSEPYKTIKTISKISKEKDCHKIVEYFMITMNKLAAKYIVKQSGQCILRVQELGCSAKYVSYSEKDNQLNNTYMHAGIEDKPILYLQCTSPIRRYIDIINIRSIFQNNYDLNLDLEYTNQTSNSIKKCQNDYTLLKLSQTIHLNGDISICEARIVSCSMPYIIIDIYEYSRRVYFKLFSKKVADTIDYQIISEGIVLNGILIKIGELIKIKVISNVLKPFVKNKISFQIIDPIISFI